MTISQEFPGLRQSLIALVFLGTALPLSAAELSINDGEIVCELDNAVPVTIAPDGSISLGVSNLEVCIPTTVIEPPGAPILSRTIVEATEPGEVRVIWTSSPNATSCTASSTPTLAEWTGQKALGENEQQLITNLAAGAYTFQLECANSAGPSPKAGVSASISAPDTSECDARQPPQGWTRLTNDCAWIPFQGYVGDCTTWAGAFGGNEFVNLTGFTRRIASARMTPTQYVALQFNTIGMSPSHTGRLLNESGSPLTYRQQMWSISTCPGDFHQAAIAAETGCYGKISTISHISWGGPDTTRSCKLQPNTTYYLNLAATDSVPGTHPNSLVPSCPAGQSCGAVIEPQN